MEVQKDQTKMKKLREYTLVDHIKVGGSCILVKETLYMVLLE